MKSPSASPASAPRHRLPLSPGGEERERRSRGPRARVQHSGGLIRFLLGGGPRLGRWSPRSTKTAGRSFPERCFGGGDLQAAPQGGSIAYGATSSFGEGRRRSLPASAVHLDPVRLGLVDRKLTLATEAGPSARNPTESPSGSSQRSLTAPWSRPCRTASCSSRSPGEPSRSLDDRGPALRRGHPRPDPPRLFDCAALTPDASRSARGGGAATPRSRTSPISPPEGAAPAEPGARRPTGDSRRGARLAVGRDLRGRRTCSTGSIATGRSVLRDGARTVDIDSGGRLPDRQQRTARSPTTRKRTPLTLLARHRIVDRPHPGWRCSAFLAPQVTPRTRTSSTTAGSSCGTQAP